QYVFTSVPNFEDSVSVFIPVKNRTGKHTVSVMIDPIFEYDEISEEDNFAQFEFIVSSSSVRSLFQYQNKNEIESAVNFLNPAVKPSDEKIIFEISNEKEFINSQFFENNLGEVKTKFELNNILGNYRYWGRTKINGSNNYSPVFSFSRSAYKYILNDSLSFAGSYLNNLNYRNGKWEIDTAHVAFEIFSAGFEDGQAAIISRNGINYVPTPLVGHHVAVFNGQPPYEFIEYKYFNTYAGGENTTNYINYLKELPENRFAAFAISDEGTPKNEELKNIIKSFGSKFIDDVKFRSSWSVWGKKGSLPGTMPEAVSNAGTGPVTVDTTINFLNGFGNFITSEIGVSGKWDKLFVSQKVTDGSSIDFIPLGVKQNGEVDTLLQLELNNSIADLS
ncbi:MAG: hypothetical protein F9K45_11140, partial [Melioribacteraceae bacterium]